MKNEYLESVLKQFLYYKMLGDRTFDQLTEEQLFMQHNPDSNSIATIVKHMAGNMLSRWTDFLTTDGEKPWRHRDAEFENDLGSKQEMLKLWEQGWIVLLDSLESLSDEDLSKIVYIRNERHTVMEAINRQLAHYPYHVGQIVFIGKMLASNWQSLSIPKGNSAAFNAGKFAQERHRGHFTDEVLNPKGSTED
ncbi:DUF1572 domain-containing protein [Pedobacter deserti]|uniref:DUF1572 domain-containing protein n=1 Tax=Pedobacter deserti TaxID=2817382 RepID=UPI00210E99D7|nr:DUF1572 domain-containing protein [Pedobacter sp. SYSU D00382]